MTDPIRELQAYQTAIRRLDKAEQKLHAAVAERYRLRHIELSAKLSSAARRLRDAMLEPESEDE